jgi:Ni,Fe-hydrogenase III small subunit
MARSPRHADIALITGGMSRAARAAALRTLDATPYPHALVAVGDCAIDGCVFRGSPLLIEDPAEALDANVEIAGCPPTPDAILAAIVEAKHLLSGDATADDAADADVEPAALRPTPLGTATTTATNDAADGGSDADDFDEADGAEEDADFDETDAAEGEDNDDGDEHTEAEPKGGRA